MSKIAITGVGIETNLGNDIDIFWNNIIQGKSGIKSLPPDHFKVARTQRIGFIDDFKLNPVFDPRWKNKTDRHIQLALNATYRAVEMSGIDFDRENPSKIHSVIGTCAGSYQSIQSNIDRIRAGNSALPSFIPGHINNMISSYVNMHYGITGSGLCLSGACAAGSQAISIGAMLIETGMADVVIAGASDSWLSEVIISGFESLGALSFDKIMPRPFDSRRDGFAISEGSAILILENQDHAKKRAADILAYLSGYGFSCDASHPTAPATHGRIVERMIMQSLEKAELTSEKIDYINAHATGTKLGDKIECQTLARIFGIDTPISSTKSMTGHSIGTSSAIEAVISIMCLQNNLIPATIHLESIDPDCPGSHVITTRQAKVEHVLSNSFGFGGTNGVLVFSKT
jgi:3-oxoacyl-[acyl-carrier-protein] synthase II